MEHDVDNGEILYGKFPLGFRWGFATASYQIEGAWNLDGKGENIWDNFTHKKPSVIVDKSNGDVACDSYHKYKEDVQLLKNCGATVYRFSLSWSRILPTGRSDHVNQLGVDYYNNLINELLLHGIEPIVTIYHWDLPQPLEEIGGWLNEEVASDFSDFANVAFEKFGDRVKTWITFNEPMVICWEGYADGTKAPGRSDNPGEEPYICAHTILKAHALAYRNYERNFRKVQCGRVGITLDCTWYEPGSQEVEDFAAAERALQFHHGWFAAPLFTGKYPPIMKEFIDRKSKAEGRRNSRLPEFDTEWSDLLKGSLDFLGLNHYTTNLVSATSGPTKPGWMWDQETKKWQDPAWEGAASKWLKMVPWGFRKLLNWIKITYGNPIVMVTENGFSDDDSVGLQDTMRTKYYKEYINNMLKAIVIDGCNVTGYTAWSLMDNFEWMRGYSERFGTHFVDFSDPNRPRTPKESTKLLKQIFTDNGFVKSHKD